jgi:hypothetical protein
MQGRGDSGLPATGDDPGQAAVDLHVVENEVDGRRVVRALSGRSPGRASSAVGRLLREGG